jgi:hypothetical protein
MLCHKGQTIHLEARVDEKFVDGSYRWKNVTVVNCHSRRFVRWKDSVGRIFAWWVCGWTDRQGTGPDPFYDKNNASDTPYKYIFTTEDSRCIRVHFEDPLHTADLFVGFSTYTIYQKDFQHPRYPARVS